MTPGEVVYDRSTFFKINASKRFSLIKRKLPNLNEFAKMFVVVFRFTKWIWSETQYKKVFMPCSTIITGIKN